MSDDDKPAVPRERVDTADSLPVIVDDDGQPISRDVSEYTASGHPRPRKTVQVLAEDTKGEIKQLGEEIEVLRYKFGMFRVAMIGEDGTNGRLGNFYSSLAQARSEAKNALDLADKNAARLDESAAKLAAAHDSIWGDTPRRHNDPPLVLEARRGKWILRALAGIAIGAVCTAAYMIRDVSQIEGTITAQMESNRDAIHSLEEEYQLLFLKLIPGAKP